MSGYTKGPWMLSEDIPPCVYADKDDEQPCIAATDAGSPWDCIDDVAEATANARLIASAPELLEALEDSTAELVAQRNNLYECVTGYHGEVPDEEDRDELRRRDAQIEANQSAIAKARSKS